MLRKAKLSLHAPPLSRLMGKGHHEVRKLLIGNKKRCHPKIKKARRLNQGKDGPLLTIGIEKVRCLCLDEDEPLLTIGLDKVCLLYLGKGKVLSRSLDKNR